MLPSGEGNKAGGVCRAGMEIICKRSCLLVWSRISNVGLLDADGNIAADFNQDADVDQSDFGILQRCLSGENSPASETTAARAQNADENLGALGAKLGETVFTN